MTPAGTDRNHTHFDKMAARYGVDRATAAKWAREKGFPGFLFTSGQGGMQIYDEDDVDAWVRDHRFGAWFQSQQGKKNPLDLPEGGPRDLLTLSQIGELEGRALNRPPTPVTTLRTYLSPSKGILPLADRTPDDGRQPTVMEPKWFRGTAYAYISRPRRTRRASSTAQEESIGNTPAPAQHEDAGALLDLDLPAGADTDLLTLQEIGELDGEARGRGKATTVGTLKNYQSQKLLAKADRTPGDGQDPAVDEPMWFRATAYRFIRRPGRLGAAARAPRPNVGTSGPLREDLKLPKGEDSDLLTLQQIGAIDGTARGRGKVTTVSSMRTYLYNGLLAKADRTPGDGQDPAVDEPMWFRATAYRFIRRPGQVGGAR
ncbi:helix-turn-helix domain-containing protein [Streptomyces sp. NPDC050485]|uniref:helix-turn-helix domain-containing protein n=1 Tax=Streptomyces sp. NPDC050485 TaxID=3365617 RepID=UPI0037966BEB